jgi:hypothetical protein
MRVTLKCSCVLWLAVASHCAHSYIPAYIPSLHYDWLKLYTDGMGEAPTSRALSAADYPHTRCSEYLEKHVLQCLEAEYARTAAQTGVSLADVERVAPIYVRQVSASA